MAHGRELLASSRRDGREVTLAVFDCSDLLEVRQIYGSSTSRKLAACIVRKLSQLAGDRGVAARTGQARFAVAMPMGREKAVEAIARVLGNPSRIELEGSNSEIVLVPNLMVESVPQGSSLDRLYGALCRGLTRIQEEEQQRQQYLKRERERHSRPMPLQAAPVSRPQMAAGSMPRLGPDPVAMQQLPPTIPMPLPAR
jgi:GGDEF domain-containing protein